MTLGLVCAAGVMAYGQNLNPSNLTNSPYSRYGFGKMETVGNSATRAMGGVGISLRNSMITNLANPASYTAIDTLTMLFDMGAKADLASFSENGQRENDWNAGFTSFSFQFPLWHNFAMAVAFAPYSTVGYSYGYTEQELLDGGLTAADTLLYTNSYSGSGGTNRFMAGIGWRAYSNKKFELNVGANVGYIFGTASHTGTFYIYSGQGQNTVISREFTTRGWDLTLGIQALQRISPRRALVYGLTFSPKTKLSIDSENLKYSNTDSTYNAQRFNLYTPLRAGVGISYIQERKWNVGAEFSFENWGKVAGLDVNLQKSNDVYKNIAKFAVGMEYQPEIYSRNYLKTVRYRAGAQVKNSYLNLNGSKNMEYTVSAGCGFPINKRSLINFSAGYTRVEPSRSGLMSEDYLSLTLGLTFNEIMFFRDKLK